MNEFTTGSLTLQEMIKIVSLLENPPEAEGVRRALRFYEVPENLRVGPYKWGTTEELRKALCHYAWPQSKVEMDWMLQWVKSAMSLLEIGSSFGGSLASMAAVMRKGCKIVSVDKACDDTPSFLNPTASLKETCRQIAALGASIELFTGDSHSVQVIDAVSNYAPFDFCFIDGDHTYEGVKADWENYGPLASIVAFHDISCMSEVNRFWNELKATGKYRTQECVPEATPGRTIFGIGVVFMEG